MSFPARTHGMSRTREYASWNAMRHRCTSPNSPSWDRYGGRGIKVCQRWMDFERFVADMGPRPPGTSLERINVDGDYEPGNVVWATEREQNWNQRRRMKPDVALFATAWVDEGFSNAEIASALGVSRSSIANIRNGTTGRVEAHADQVLRRARAR